MLWSKDHTGNKEAQNSGANGFDVEDSLDVTRQKCSSQGECQELVKLTDLHPAALASLDLSGPKAHLAQTVAQSLDLVKHLWERVNSGSFNEAALWRGEHNEN
ncbi:hypothetical protein GX48_05368 [Paracoccidioides brasiliensis]|nr:hypothetical protein GX48_05368 [Paracoccidioides brasiliensis]